jgi:hypothetical protein
MYRHGDLLIEKTNIPKGCKKRKSSIILDGEVTGHAHRLNNGIIFEKGELVYLRVVDKATVTHEEHSTITLPAGDYQVIRQREYRPYDRAAEFVRD